MQNIIDAGLKLISNSGGDHLKPHLIFCMKWFFNAQIGEVLWNFVLEKIKEYDIKSVLVTMVDMTRKHLITKGLVESQNISFCQEKTMIISTDKFLDNKCFNLNKRNIKNCMKENLRMMRNGNITKGL